MSWKILGQNFSFVSTSDCFNHQETSSQVGGWEGQENSEIITIPNKYKDNLNDLIGSSDPKPSD